MYLRTRSLPWIKKKVYAKYKLANCTCKHSFPKCSIRKTVPCCSKSKFWFVHNILNICCNPNSINNTGKKSLKRSQFIQKLVHERKEWKQFFLFLDLCFIHHKSLETWTLKVDRRPLKETTFRVQFVKYITAFWQTKGPCSN